MNLEWDQGPRGPRLSINGLQQWSAYDAPREAQRWVETLGIPDWATVFVAGDTGGYVANALSQSHPEVRTVRLLAEVPSGNLDDPWLWWPGRCDLAEFLSSVLSRTGPFDCHWFVWPAFERAAPHESLAWGRIFRDVFRTVQGTWLTWKHSGKTWWRNAERNARKWAQPVEIVRGTRPIIVVASGPSLDGGWETLRSVREDVELWALPSSFQALKIRGLIPDVAVCTDGGFWAKEHLQRLSGLPTVVLAALSSAPDPILEQRPTLFFSQGLAWERWLLQHLPGTVSEVPAQGTVAVTALQWALAATTGPVFIAGLDLCFSDFRAHAQGHTVERRLAPEVGRLRPWETLWGERALAQAPLVLEDGERTSPAMRTYALWLGKLGLWPRTVHRLAPTGVEVSGMKSSHWKDLPDLVKDGRLQSPVRWSTPAKAWPDEEQRARSMAQAVEGLKKGFADGSFSAAELMRWAETLAPDALADQLSETKNPRANPISDSRLAGRLVEAFDALPFCAPAEPSE